MPIIRIDKSIADEIENMLERRDKMYEDQRARALKLSNRLEKLYTQELKKLRSQLQQKENIIKEVREYINNHQLVFEMSSKKQIAYWFDMFYKELLEILDKGDDK